MSTTCQCCEKCKWWKLGDPIEKIENIGLCTWALRNKAPEKLKHLTMSMVSWEGERCPVYRGASAQVQARNRYYPQVK